MQDTDAAADDDARAGRVQWRQLGRRLWVGHEGTHGVGTIEQGARFVYVDADGVAYPAVDSLHEAQDVATGPIRLPVRAEPPPPRRLRPDVVVLVVALVLVLVLTWVIGRALVVG